MEKASEMVADLQELIADANCDVDVKIAAIRAIGLLGPSARASVPTLIQSLTDSNNHVREITVSTLSRFCHLMKRFTYIYRFAFS